jgi:hypothetical protein
MIKVTIPMTHHKNLTYFNPVYCFILGKHVNGPCDDPFSFTEFSRYTAKIHNSSRDMVSSAILKTM